MRDMPYHKAVDTLSWAALAMPPDPTLSLAMAIHLAVNPKPTHWEPTKWTSHHLSIIHAKTSNLLEGFANMNGSMVKDWHAISGHASFFDGSTVPLPLRWYKDILLPSTDKSEHIVATHSSNKALWLYSLVSMFFGNLKNPTTFVSDTLAAMPPCTIANTTYAPSTLMCSTTSPIGPSKRGFSAPCISLQTTWYLTHSLPLCFLPMRSTSLHHLDCMQSEGECCGSGSQATWTPHGVQYTSC